MRDDPKGPGFPIRTSADQRLLSSPRGFSQSATSFIASWCQGIHQMPLTLRLIALQPDHPFRPPGKPGRPSGSSDRSATKTRPMQNSRRTTRTPCGTQTARHLPHGTRKDPQGYTSPAAHETHSPATRTRQKADRKPEQRSRPAARKRASSRSSYPRCPTAGGPQSPPSRAAPEPPSGDPETRRETFVFSPAGPAHRQLALPGDPLAANPRSRERVKPSLTRGRQTLAGAPAAAGALPAGGADRDRTGDLKLAKLALSRLSYGPFRAAGSRAGQKWWAWEDLNFRPHAYQARALTN